MQKCECAYPQPLTANANGDLIECFNGGMPILLWLAAQYRPPFDGHATQGQIDHEAQMAVAWATALLAAVNAELEKKYA